AMSSGDDDLRALDILDPGHGGDLAAQGQKVLVWVDQGYWLLLPLLLLGLLAFRRGNQLALLLLCMWLPWQPAHAAQDWWLRPDQQAHARMEQGAQAYRKGDFAAAHALWRGIPDADAAYNRGNALAKQGDYDSAIAAYDEALQLQPGMPDAIANKRAVEAARRRQSAAGKQPGHQGKGDGQQQSQRGGQQQSAQQKGQQQSGQQQSGQQRGQQQNGEQQKGQAQPPQAPPTSPATQRQADAAQRQRMQEALRRQAMAQRAGVKPGARPSQRAESPAERERRLANEAWLQRVPDDPGGLLRARFQLEYERRQQEGP
ncbi:MAG: hypothetical protein JWL98_910, partial [Xanthomonadaceae bacterium]|nr:hypothetical protein [Xanthomonadaceae bacterium]